MTRANLSYGESNETLFVQGGLVFVVGSLDGGLVLVEYSLSFDGLRESALVRV